MADEVELVGLELSREIRVVRDELLKKRDLVAKLSKSETLLTSEVEELTAKLKKTTGEVQEVKAQLQVRSEATQRLEQENISLRDTVARLQVQVDSNHVERERLVQRWQMAETDRVNWKEKCELLQDAASETNAFKEQCLLLQNQLRTTVSKIASQQEILQKEYLKVEKAAQDSLAFVQMVAQQNQRLQANEKNCVLLIEEAEKKCLQLKASFDDIRRERDQLLSLKDESSHQNGNYFQEWEQYQQIMKQRIEGFICENQQLAEELSLVQENAKHVLCPQCKEKVDTSTTST